MPRTDGVVRTESWALSPRWRLSEGPQTRLDGPGGWSMALDGAQRAALESAFSGVIPVGHERWVESLLVERVLVPAHLAAAEGPAAEAEAFYRQVLSAYCKAYRAEHLEPRVQAELGAWSGTVLRQPLSTHRAYLPSRPSVCIDLDPRAAPAVRLCVDWRNPLLTPWENVQLVRRTFAGQLQDGASLFEQVCEGVFRDPDWFQNPYIKYLHPAVEVLEPGRVRTSAYWNLGAGTRDELWDRALALVQAVGGDAEREEKLREAVGDRVAPELVGHTIDPSKPRVLKLYHVLYGYDAQALDALFGDDDYPGRERVLARIITGFPMVHPENSRWIASLYHDLGSHRTAGLKLHTYLMASAAGHTVRMGEAARLAAAVTGNAVVVPEHLTLADGGHVRIRPSVLSYMFRGGQGMTGATLYADFAQVGDPAEP